MSRYEWEGGTIVIPSARWLSLRRQLIEDWNAIGTKRFALAQSLHAHLTTVQGKDHRELEAQAWRWAEEKAQRIDGVIVDCPRAPYDVIRLVLPGATEPAKARWPRVPEKRYMPFARSNARRLFPGLGLEWDGRLRFDDPCSLVWKVPQNNHAVEDAWEHPMGKRLARALAEIDWKPRSGGRLYGGDELHHGPFIRRRFGPLGREPPQQD